VTLTTYLLFALLFYFLHVLSATTGIRIADRLNIGDLCFDPGSDLKKMAVVSAIALPIPMVIFYFAPSAGAIIIYLLIFFTACKIAYMGITVPELVIVALTNLLGLGIFRVIIVSTILIVLFCLFIILGFILLIHNRFKAKKYRQKRQAFEKRKRAEIKNILNKNPEFRTICSECKFFDFNKKYCIHHLVDEMEDFKLNRNGFPVPFCLYWEM